MKKILVLLLLLILTIRTQEQKIQEPEIYVVGRFVIEHTEQGYQAQTGDTISSYQKTMYRSIQEIQ